MDNLTGVPTFDMLSQGGGHVRIIVGLRDDQDIEYLQVTYPPGATGGSLLEALNSRNAGQVEELYVGRSRVRHDQPIGHGALRQGCLLTRTPRGDLSPPAHGWWISVTSGSSTGRWAAVGTDGCVLGRAPGNQVRCDDPTVSRRAATLTLTLPADISDSGAPYVLMRTSPASLPSATSGSAPDERLHDGDCLRLGQSLLALHGPSRSLTPPPEAPEVAEPASPTRMHHDTNAGPHSWLPVPALVSAVVMAAGWAMLLGARGALLAALSAGSLVTAFAVDAAIRKRRRSQRAQREEAEQASLQAQTRVAHVQRGRNLRQRHPDAAQLQAQVTTGSGWTPTTEDVHVRVGTFLPDLLPCVLRLEHGSEVRVSGPHSRCASVGGFIVVQVASHFAALPGERLHLAVTEQAEQLIGRWVRLLSDIDAGPDRSQQGWTLQVSVEVPPAGSGSLVIRLLSDASSSSGSVEVTLVRLSRGATSTASVQRHSAERPDDLVPDLPDPGLLESTARSLLSSDQAVEPVWEAQSEAWLGQSPLEPAGLRKIWRSPPPGCTAVLGVGDDGQAWTLDLAADGPHVLIGGTTGSGKSQLLRSLVLGLASCYSPSHLQFVLLDFKGGSTFSDFSDLPHVRQLGTDLQQDWARLALTRLLAEVVRREQALAAAGSASFEDLPGDDRNREPRLILVIDEFATLKDEQPDLLESFVDLARRGRSLGLHLVLATQRPSGAVSREIQANVAVRIALRTASAEDSQEILGCADAARLPASEPGSALVSQDGEPRRVSVLRIGSKPRSVIVEPWPPEPTRAHGSGSAEDEARIRDLIVTEANRGGHAWAQPMWAPPLPDQVTPSHVAELLGERPHSDDGLAVGLRQTTDLASLTPLLIPVTAGFRAVIHGGPRSGRTTALAAALAASRQRPDGIRQTYVIDGGHAPDLRTATVACLHIPLEDPERIHLLLDDLCARDAPSPAAGERSTADLLVIDRMDRLLERYRSTPIPDMLIDALGAAKRSGLVVLASSGQQPLDSRTAQVTDLRFVLPLTDAIAYAGHGIRLPNGSLPRVPGRALIPGSEDQAQFLVPPSDVPRPAGPRRGGHRALMPLPEHVDLAALLSARTDEPPDALPIAAGPGGDVVAVNLTPGCSMLITSPRGGGRSSTLHMIAHQLTTRGIPTALLTPTSRSDSPEESWDATYRSVSDSWERPDGEPRAPRLLVIDDIDQLTDEQTRQAMHLITIKPTPASIVVAAELDAVHNAYRRPLLDFQRADHVLVLSPRRKRDVDLWSIDYPVYGPWPPGRAILSSGGTAMPCQIAVLPPQR